MKNKLTDLLLTVVKTKRVLGTLCILKLDIEKGDFMKNSVNYNGAINNLVGKEVYGFCEGFFGSSSYDDKLIIMNGLNWVVGMPEDGLPEVAYFKDFDEMMNWYKDNSEKENDY